MADPWKRKEVIGNATLYLGDCLEILPVLPKVDAVITDPPYGIGFAAQPTAYPRKNGMKPTNWDDAAVPIRVLGAVLFQGPINVVWGGNYYANHFLPSRGWLSWFKPDAPPSMANFELAWTNLDRNARQISCSIAETNAERCGHPTQKPLKVMRWCIDQVGSPESIFDPFMGSGSTGVAAVQMGLKFIGIELYEPYFDIACQRIENAQKQVRMFPGDDYDRVTVEQKVLGL